MLETIKDSSAALAVLPLKIPTILGASEPVAFDVKSMQKDLRSMLATGGETGVQMRMAEGALAAYSAAAESGLGSSDAVAPTCTQKQPAPKFWMLSTEYHWITG